MKTTVIIQCKDGTVRVLKLRGFWSALMAEALGKDLERDNFKSAKVDVQ